MDALGGIKGFLPTGLDEALMNIYEHGAASYVQCADELGPSESTGTAPSSSNAVGTITFLAYIAAALLFTYFILASLRKAYRALPLEARSSAFLNAHMRRTSLLALISFLTLSYNMLAFLVESFNAYRSLHSRQQSGLSLRVFISEARAWMLHSSLFTDFTKGLMASEEAFLWSWTALMGTLAAHMYIAHMGHKFEIPGLALYAILAQILPVSFTVSLFSIAVCISKAAAGKGKQSAGPPRSEPASIVMVVQATLVGLYFLFISYLPCFGNGSWSELMTVVALVRIDLFVPYIFSSLVMHGHSNFLSILVVVAAVVMPCNWPRSLLWLWTLGAEKGDYAVRALGMDFVLLLFAAYNCQKNYEYAMI